MSLVAARLRQWLFPRDFLQLLDQFAAGVPFPVSFVKQLRANDAVLVEHECCWVWDARNPLRRFFISNPVSIYDLAAIIGE